MSDDLPERIVTAAIRLLETHGPKGFGQVRVAREAGVGQGHLTYYFPRKSDLAAAVLERLNSDARQELGPLVAQAGQSPDALEELFFAIVQTMLQSEKRHRVMLGLVTAALEDRELAEVLAKQFSTQRAAMGQLLGRGPDDPDVHIALAALRGFGVESLIAHGDRMHAGAILARFRTWLGTWRRSAGAQTPTHEFPPDADGG